MAFKRPHDIWQIFTGESFTQLVYAASMLTVPESVIKIVQENHSVRLSMEKQERQIKRMVMYQPVGIKEELILHSR